MRINRSSLLTVLFSLDLTHGFRLSSEEFTADTHVNDVRISDILSPLKIFQSLLKSSKSGTVESGSGSRSRGIYGDRAEKTEVEDVDTRADYFNYHYYDYSADYPYWVGNVWNDFNNDVFCKLQRTQKPLPLAPPSPVFRPYRATCGFKDTEKRSLSQTETKIVGGSVADAGEWPWLVGIGLKAGGLHCGATLITRRWLITAAHCFERRENPCDFNARLGEHHLFIGNEPHVDITFQKIINHPNYNRLTNANDIALVRLSMDAPIDEYDDINIVCPPEQREPLVPGEQCWVAGWGRLDEDYYGIAPRVRHVSVPVLSRRECRRAYRDTFVHGKQFCAGDTENGGKDACQGDSGGPLVCLRDGKWELIGVTSWGVGCGRADRPGVYTFVPQYVKWINRVISTYGD